jgi:hypothetical protein
MAAGASLGWDSPSSDLRCFALIECKHMPGFLSRETFSDQQLNLIRTEGWPFRFLYESSSPV